MRIGRSVRTAVTFAFLAAFGVLPPATSAENTTTYTVFLAITGAEGELERVGSSAQFGCTETIYLVVQSDGEPAAPLKAYWFDPLGKEQIRVTREFETRDAIWWSWSGLQLKRPAGASLLGVIDPSAGLEGFIGDW